MMNQIIIGKKYSGGVMENGSEVPEIKGRVLADITVPYQTETGTVTASAYLVETENHDISAILAKDVVSRMV